MPAAVMIAPTSRASAEPRATASLGSSPAASTGTIVAAIIGPSDESGPSTRIFDGPNTA